MDRTRARHLIGVWAVSVLVLTLAPFAPLRAQPRTLEWHGWDASRLGLFDVVANALMFLPLGVLFVRAGGRRAAAVALGCGWSVAIELLQRHVPLRNPSWLDVYANTAGVALGACFAGPLLRFGLRVYVRPVRWALLLAGGAGALLAAAHFPQLARFTVMLPFAVAVLGAMVAASLWPRELAFALAAVGVALVCTHLAWPTDPWWLAAGGAGALLGSGMGTAATA
mgnify:FL=1